MKFCGVGGSEEAVPIASWGVGGVVERSERRDLVGSMGSWWTNWSGVSSRKTGIRRCMVRTDDVWVLW